MANRRPQQSGGRRMDFGRNDRGKNFGRSGVSPWQGGGPGAGLPNLLPLSGGPTEATLALASNIINLLQPRQNPVPSLLDMPIRRDFGPDLGRYDRGYGPSRMGNQGNFRRTGNYNRAGERINTNRKPFRPNDGPRQQNKSSPKKDADSKAKPIKESEEKQEQDSAEKSETKEEESKKEAPKTRYDDIDAQLLRCHICNKSMWDGRSFENHLSGRAHAIMMQKTAESYALTADTMRQEFKIREMKRTRKTGQQPPRDFYCAMCDLYAADGAIHRTTVGHRKLKKYLHPTCTSCHKEMPTRIELDEHRLTAEHLKNIQDKQDYVSKPKPEVMVISTLTMEQSYLREDRQRRRQGHAEDKHEEKPTDDEKKDGDNEDVEIKEEIIKTEDQEGQENKEDTETKKSIELDNADTVLDYTEGDDLTHFTQDMVPAYSTERGVGRSFLKPFSCVQCRLCRKLLDSEETAEVHLRTWRHHQLFVRLISEKSGSAQAQQQTDGGKRPLNGSEENGNWKRRKTTPEANDDDDSEEITPKEEVKTEGAEDEADAEGDVEMPSEDALEDWEQSVDEILLDEMSADDIKKEATTNEEEEKKEDEKEEEKPAEDDKSSMSTRTTAARGKTRGSPRGRGRGRRRN